ncbi:MAG: molybdopterin-binding oxidoreductase [Candidatus Rokubacteria bacterium 13_1_40CM_4_69_39]|jgi:anaerobic selenocysteine-containing dehydrogenase|nr:MAG: molybdopterin-binding oxidoreductase [Candidatus Rokubacteria bacterium 13_1_40CM_4_69_39]OLC98380.1 MAG: molybdopterin-binding oxidoreductase [Candidatus Rokubacteria bacterium 13_1_40CM_3_69_38]OLD23878.1 MAG: molybdopterin-binding oxidoreductase [Candidatus Rokubacteria bacterium 13_1_40CM_2_70_45]OLE46553.1 MAG: molybdopterin-binding oxidoreductase [Candidatus Rokubacteria bacterium 13_1_20CM_2_69_58]PYM52312.1 MAG: molybdopterin-binding oxidoreductase [Candidatus Rokubacteria bacte
MAAVSVERPSVCPLDCPDTCSLTVTVEEDRIVEIRGSHANPYTGGVLCAKVPQAYPEFVHGAGRLRTPLRRVGARGEGRFERITWGEALDAIHARFSAIIAAHGPEAILPLNYAGPHGMLAGGSMDLRFFHKLGASLLDRRPLCGGIRTEAWVGTFGPVPGIRPEQVADARLIVVWGNNVTWSNLHLMPWINRARKAGARLVVVDPRRTVIARRADLHLALRPGTDVVLAWAVAAELERRGGIDRAFVGRHVEGVDEFMALARRWSVSDAARVCGVSQEDVRAFAEWYHTLSPAAISVGNGLERNQNGGSGIRAIFALPALAGKFGVPGGGLVNGASFAFPKTPGRLARPDLVPEGTRTLNIIDVGRHLLDASLVPPIKAVFIYNHNPVVVHPDATRLQRGLAREDLFVVGADVVMTDSMTYADVVLPAASHFEHADLYPAYGQHWLQRAEPAIRPQGEALPNTEIFRRLAARFGLTDPIFRASDAELMDDALDPDDPRLGGVRPSRLSTERALAMSVAGEDAILFKNVFPKTPSGKVELASAYLERKYHARLPGWRPVESRYALALISPASDQRITSTFGGLHVADGAPPLEMHPDDALARGLREGMRVRVFNELGEIHLPLKISDAVPRGVVSTLKGAWLATSDNGQTVSALCPAHHADISEGACFNDARVEVAAT